MKRGIVAGSIIIIILALISLSISAWVFHNKYLQVGETSNLGLTEQFGFPLFLLIFGIIMIVIGFILLIDGFATKPKIKVGTGEGSKEDEVLKALKLRYAKGDITQEQFEQMKKELNK